MKRRNKILTSGGIVVLAAICFYVFFPILIAPPLPFYHIENNDVNNHEVVVKVFDQDNKTIFKKTHMLGPKEEIRQSKPFLLKFTWPEGEYTFKVTLDSEITKTYETKMYPTLMVVIRLYHGEINPIISIGAVVV